MTWAWRQQVVESATDRFVLLALANYASPDGEHIFPSVARIQQMTGLSERSVQNARKRLLDAGVLVETGATHKGCREFEMPGVQEMHPPGAGDAPKPSVQPSDMGEQKKESKLSKEVEEVWEHYVAVFNATRQTLDPKRTTIIRNALKVRSVAECKRAIDGLRVSPWHNGENDGKKKYLGIRYALSGIGQESNDERIDKMIAIADEHTPVGNGLLPMDHHRIQRWLRQVRYTCATGGERERGVEALRKLREQGYDVTKLDRPPHAILIDRPQAA